MCSLSARKHGCCYVLRNYKTAFSVAICAPPFFFFFCCWRNLTGKCISVFWFSLIPTVSFHLSLLKYGHGSMIQFFFFLICFYSFSNNWHLCFHRSCMRRLLRFGVQWWGWDSNCLHRRTWIKHLKCCRQSVVGGSLYQSVYCSLWPGGCCADLFSALFNLLQSPWVLCLFSFTCI